MILTLLREALEPVTLGRLKVDGMLLSHTLELPWRSNQKGVSCIPPGVYQVAFFDSPKFKRAILRLNGVPGREGILIHPANHVAELRGCIALGVRANVHSDYLIESRKFVDSLEAMVLRALDRKEPVCIEVINPGGKVS
jgi:7-cyano-7-deazaguanine synthase in queuosine biosynthesis